MGKVFITIETEEQGSYEINEDIITVKQWRVRSFSDKDTYYIITHDINSGKWTCTCPVHVNTNRECKHISSVKSNPDYYDKLNEFVLFDHLE